MTYYVKLLLLLLLLLLQRHVQNELIFQQFRNLEFRSIFYRFYNFWPLCAKLIREKQTCYLYKL